MGQFVDMPEEQLRLKISQLLTRGLEHQAECEMCGTLTRDLDPLLDRVLGSGFTIGTLLVALKPVADNNMQMEVVVDHNCENQVLMALYLYLTLNLRNSFEEMLLLLETRGDTKPTH